MSSAVAALEGKTAIVTGASSGIGAATARALAAEGAGRRRRPPASSGSRRRSRSSWTSPTRASCAALRRRRSRARRAGHPRQQRRARARPRPVRESTEDGRAHRHRDQRPRPAAHDAPLLPAHPRRGPHRQPRLGGRLWSYPSGARYVASKFAVPRLHACAARRPARQRRSASRTSRRASSRPTSRRCASGATRRRRGGLRRAIGGPLSAEDVAECILFALTRPPNVNVDEIVLMALAQSSGARIHRATSS